MRVTLVVPPVFGDWGRGEGSEDEPIELLGLGYVAAVARENGHDVDILNCKFQALDHEQTVQQIQALNPRVVGITASWGLDLGSGVKLSLALRDAGYDGLIVIGGHSATFTFQNLLSRFPSIDVVIRGEGEFSFLELLQRLDEGRDWQQVAGIAYREDGQVVTTESRPLITDLDALPFPARDNVATDGLPSSLVFCRERGFAPRTVLLSSRGCPFNCAFCSVQAFYGLSRGSKWRPRSAESVVDEMAYLVEKWGMRHFMFSDDNFIGSCPKGKARAQRLAHLLIERDLGVTFNVECCVKDVELSLFSLLKRAGLVQVHLGIESGVPRVLESFNKPTTVEKNSRAVSILKKLGLDFFPNFILMDPDTTLEELGQNLTFFKETGIHRVSMAFPSLCTSRLMLFAGTAAHKHYQEANRTKPLLTPGLGEEEQRIMMDTGVVLGYDIQDPRVGQFLEVLPGAISEIVRRSGSLTRLEQQHRPRAGGTVPATAKRLPGGWPALHSSVGRWHGNVSTLALRFFEQALALAGQGAINAETAAHHLDEFVSEIDRYDVRHFGKTVDELVQAARTEPAVA